MSMQNVQNTFAFVKDARSLSDNPCVTPFAAIDAASCYLPAALRVNTTSTPGGCLASLLKLTQEVYASWVFFCAGNRHQFVLTGQEKCKHNRFNF